jgi:DNA polymerase III delta prime subunit
MNTLWLEKYNPKKISDIVGHKEIISQIIEWITNFSKSNNSSLIISGNHGIGKNITINLILKELNYDIIYISSSNIKDNKSINKILIKNDSIEFFKSNKKSAIIIDNTENITLSTEKNMLLELYKENEKKKILPIFFLTNEQHSKLISDIKKTCYEIKFTVPLINDFLVYIKNICKLEDINITDEKILLNIIKFTQFDIRKLIYILQDLKFTFGNTLIDLCKCKKYFQSTQKKNMDIGLFDSTKELLDNYKSIDKCLNLYETEKVLLPLMIFENYPKSVLNRNYSNGVNFYESISKISDSISMGDVIETNIYTDQNWYLQSLHGMYTCCFTTYELSKFTQKNNKYNIIFSSDLNKTSIKNINKKNINIIQNKINKNINDILLLNKLLYYLLKNEKYNKIKKIFKKYYIIIKYLDTILKIDKTIEKFNLTQKIKKLILIHN